MPLAGQIIRAQDFTGEARVTLIGDQSIGNNSNTTVQFNTVEFDDSGFWNAAAFRFEIPAGMGGLYSIQTNVCFASNSTGNRSCNLVVTGARVGTVWMAPNPTNVTRLFCAATVPLVAGDTVLTQAFQTSGGSLNVTGSSTNNTFLSIARIRAE
jgi:hypothetical protein